MTPYDLSKARITFRHRDEYPVARVASRPRTVPAAVGSTVVEPIR
jgi:hypothetical protein